MKSIVLFSIVSLLSITHLFAQTTKKCDSDILVRTSEKMGFLNKEEVKSFLMTFGAECKNNVEFSQWSNELLFLLIDAQTEMTLKILEKENKKIEMNVIFEDISSPIHDIRNIPKIIEKAERVRIDRKLKGLVIGKLQEGLID